MEAETCSPLPRTVRAHWVKSNNLAGYSFHDPLCTVPFLCMYRRAAQLRPRDPRMWCALGQSYESAKLGMFTEAIKCYR
jgi:hypothetical protein